MELLTKQVRSASLPRPRRRTPDLLVVDVCRAGAVPIL